MPKYNDFSRDWKRKRTRPSPAEWRLLGDRVLVCVKPKSEVEEMTAGGVIIPRSVAEDHQQLLQGRVVAVGPLVMDVQVGQLVIGSRFARTPVDTDGRCWVCSEDSIICTVDDD